MKHSYNADFARASTRERAQCGCNHDPRWLYAAINTRHYPQEYHEVDGKYVLVCMICGGLWDHRATDRLIELVMRGEWAGAR
jgi:hypothetical protein